MKSLTVCKRWQVFLSAGLAVTVCGMAARPALAQTASITFLNDFTNSAYYDFWLHGMSDDASVIGGNIGIQGNDGSVVNQAFRWTADTGIVFFAPPPGYGPDGTVADVSADGTKMILSFGSSVVSGGGRFSWTAGGGYVDVGSDLPGGVPYSSVWAISADGSTIVGWSKPALDTFEAYSRAGDGTVFSLGDLAGGSFQSQAFDVSGDGSVVVGNGTIDQYGFDLLRATRWTKNSSGTGYDMEVPDFASANVCDSESRTWAVSEDGTVAMGEVTTVDGTEVFRWTADGGVDLPFRSAGKSASYSRLMSTDGSLIAGAPGIWVEATNGIVTLGDIQDTLVNDFGVDMGGWDITTTGSSLEAISVTPQGVILLGRIQLSVPSGPNGAKNDGLPYIIRLPYLPIGATSDPTCSMTWESSVVGYPGLSVQPPWEPYDSNATEQVSALEVFDDGNGPALYAGGIFKYAGGNYVGNGVAKWDGQNWSPVGIGVAGQWPWVSSLTTLDDGTGPALYVTGEFDTAGGAFARKIAKWDGQTWSAMGSGLGAVNGLVAFDDGTGPAIYAGGIFRAFAGDPFTDGVAKWTGSQWVQLGSGLANSVGNASARIVVFDDGTGPALYAQGDFDTAGGLPVGSSDMAKWDGQNWSVIPMQLGAVGMKMAWDDGTGSALYFTRGYSAQGPSQFVKWDGQTWTDAFVTSEPFVGPDSSVFKTLRGEMDDGNGPAMFATTSLPSELYRWDGQDWVSVRSFGCGGIGAIVYGIAQFDDSQGNGIYMGGRWTQAGGEVTRNIAMLRACTVPHPGDCNADGVVDMMDFDLFSGCLSGPGGGLGIGCECSDVNGDGDVDLGDFQAFMASFTG